MKVGFFKFTQESYIKLRENPAHNAGKCKRRFKKFFRNKDWVTPVFPDFTKGSGHYQGYNTGDTKPQKPQLALEDFKAFEQFSTIPKKIPASRYNIIIIG